ncbi:MAG: ribonuclease P protein component [Gammaproteobacteria bacterium]|nr:ribonuclease P protein component [Gammaproteobacteria bacterium]MCP4475691.1 ribonuclease P protein component [Gammaproteobacteria bacterium]
MTTNTNAFPRSCRLLSARDYQQFFKGVRRIYTRHFVILYKPNQLATARLGLAISKKRVKRAVHRNRIKRVIRESFRHHQTILTALDITVVMSKEARKASTALVKLDLRSELDKQWQQLKNLSR